MAGFIVNSVPKVASSQPGIGASAEQEKTKPAFYTRLYMAGPVRFLFHLPKMLPSIISSQGTGDCVLPLRAVTFGANSVRTGH
jgi:hypothetical protein